MNTEYQKEAYELDIENDALKHDINELNARLLERQIAFNEADKRRVARIQELEDQLRLANTRIQLLEDEVKFQQEERERERQENKAQ